MEREETRRELERRRCPGRERRRHTHHPGPGLRGAPGSVFTRELTCVRLAQRTALSDLVLN